jgi:alkylation response protein AidB-like acyl-CoA dehydrogenase
MAFSASRSSGQFSGVVIAQEGLVQAALLQALDRLDALGGAAAHAAQRIDAGVIHRGRQAIGDGRKVCT